jgi:branched-chain amino acid aminotransferase
MALLPIHKYFILNGQLKPISEFIPSENNGGIYEVLRVVRGVPLFLEDHLSRLYKSANIAQKKILYSKLEIRSFLKLLIQNNKVSEGNLLISCKTNLKLFYITHDYPSISKYNAGVNCGILNTERVNPNAKVFQTSVREKANKLISEQGFYEVILVDKQYRITEGSRSNLFFIKENKIITSPGNKVLLGITRQKTIALAKKLDFNFEEQYVMLNDLHLFDACFITGTSAKILPVKQIENTLFDSQNKIVQKLIEEYNSLIKDYINLKSVH